MSIFYEERQQPYFCSISTSLNYPPHLHKQLEFGLLLDGELELRTADRDFTLHAGECLFIPPNQIHSYRCATTCRLLLLIADPGEVEQLQALLQEQQPAQPVFTRAWLSPDGRSALDMMTRRVEARTPFALTDLGLLLVLLDDIFRRVPCEARRMRAFGTVEQVLIYMDRHYTEPLSERSVAAAVGISRFHLSRIFSETLRIPYRTYLQQRRIQRAEHLLANTDSPITAIAFESGFSNTRTFNRVFQAATGMTPGRYRSTQKGNF